MGYAEDILAIVAATFDGENGACTVRIKRHTFAAVCSGMEEIRTPTDQGIVSGYSGNVRYALSVEAVTIDAGDVFEFKRTGIDADFITARALARSSIGGAVRLSISAEFAQ
jgi:hypothetical protein